MVTDSQAFLKVAADTPPDVPMTSFSILIARFQGDWPSRSRGTLAIERLKAGDRVLVAEACTHHPIGEDIGRVKIPRWLTQYVGAKLEFATVQGRDFPDDLSPYRLVVHCGTCMWNRREMLSRIVRCREAGVPITNYGLTIAYSLGIFERALGPFPAALEAYHARGGPDDPRRDPPAGSAKTTRPAGGALGAGRRRPPRARRRRGPPARPRRDLQPLRPALPLLRDLRAANRDLVRYRMTADEILACAGQAAAFGYGTVVLQAGED